jgi:hypothetical protein
MSEHNLSTRRGYVVARLKLPLVVMLTVAAVGWLSRPREAPPVVGEGGTYTYTVEASGPDDNGNPTYRVVMDLAEPARQDNDFSAYKAESNARLDAWIADPGSAPVVDGKQVKVTFTSPQSYASTISIVGPYAASYVRHAVVGHSPNTAEHIMEGLGDIDPSSIGDKPNVACGISVDENGQPDPADCETVTWTGIIEVDILLQGGLAGLAAMRDNPSVFLVDTTGIEVLRLTGLNQSQLQTLAMPFPMADDGVTYP